MQFLAISWKLHMMYIKEFLGGKYMKKYFIALSIMMLMLSACGHSNDRIDFPQAVLSTPTSIKVNNGISEIYLTPEQLEFSEVVALIERNWWKTIKDINEPLTDANLKDMDAPIKILNLKFVNMKTNFLLFYCLFLRLLLNYRNSTLDLFLLLLQT